MSELIFEEQDRTANGDQDEADKTLAAGGAFADGEDFDHKPMEENLRANENQLRLITDNIPALISYVDSEFCYRFVNQRYSDWFGLAPEDIVGKYIWEVVGEAAFAAALPDLRLALAGERVTSERIMPYKNGGSRFVEIQFVPDADTESGRIRGFYALIIDISERRRRERNADLLTSIGEDFTRLVEPGKIMCVVGEKICAFLNLSSCAFNEIEMKRGETRVPYGWFRRDVPNLIGGVYRHEDFVTDDFHRALLAGETVVVRDTQTDPRTDRAAYAKIKMSAFITVPFFRENELKFLLAVTASEPRNWQAHEIELIRELSNYIFPHLEAKRAEAALRQSEANYRTLFDSIDQGYCIIEMVFDTHEKPLDYRFVQINPAFARLTGLPEDAVGKTARELVPDLEEFWFETYGRVARTGESIRFENYAAPMNRWFDVYALRVGEAAHNLVGLLFANITRRKQAEADAAFLLENSETIRRSETVEEMLGKVVRAIGRHLKVSRAFFVELDAEGETAIVHQDFYAKGLSPIGEKMPLSRFSPDSIEMLRAGKILVNDDTKNNPRTADFYETGYKALGMNAFVGVPLLRNSRWTAGLAVIHQSARRWTEAELNLLETVAERAWLAVEKLRHEAALRESKEVMRLAMETANIYSWQFDLKTKKAVYSGDVERVVGFALPEDFDELLKYIHPNDCKEVAAGLRETFEKKTSYSHETRYVNPTTEEIVWLQTQGAFIRATNNESLRLVGITQNVTTRKRAEDNLRESEERLRLAVAISQTATFDIDLLTDAVQTDDTGREIYGWDSSPLTFSQVQMQFHPDDRERVMQAVGAAFAPDGAGEFVVEQRIIRSDGATRWILVHGRAFFAGEGNAKRAVRCLGTYIDITERKKAEQEVRESEERLRLATEAAEMFSWEVDVATQQIKWSENAAKIIGCRETDLPNDARHSRFFVFAEDDKRISHEFKQAIAAGETHYVADFCSAPDGEAERKFWQAQCLIIYDAAKNPVRVVGVTQNVTAEKRADLERERLLESEQRAREQAEDANRLKDEFLATVSHELRTPLNAILGWSTIARQNRLDQESLNRALEVIERSARNQNQIISDILDVSRIITGKLNLAMQSVDLAAVVRAAVDAVRPAVDVKKIRLETNLARETEIVTGDPDRLQQIIWNLLTNALKFTPSGGRIEVTLQYQTNTAEISVCDNGEGIEQEFLPYVFDRFRQADGKMNRKHGGLGLGLAIVRHLTELHGGQVAATSAGAGAGATFTVCLPLKSPVESGKNSAAKISGVNSEPISEFTDHHARRQLDGLKILVVDDEPDALELADFILTGNGAQVFTAESVDEALKIFERETLDLVISDVGMPGRDGYEFIREIKARAKDQNRRLMPTIALTAYAREEDGRGLLLAGYEGYLPKPLEPTRLIETILELTVRPTI